jgi:hypothetical protein
LACKTTGANVGGRLLVKPKIGERSRNFNC